MNELLELYRQALRSVEFLPTLGSVPSDEFLTDIPKPVFAKQNLIRHFKASYIQARIHNADWFKYRFAIRWLVRIFIHSHIRSKLRNIITFLEVERLASRSMNEDTRDQLEDAIAELRKFVEYPGYRNIRWLKLFTWMWTFASPILPIYISYVLSNSSTVIAILSGSITFLLIFILLVWAPLYLVVVLGGFRWKRLILVGQAGDVNIDIASNASLCWAIAPQANVYLSENRLYQVIGLPKPLEFPWDLILSPVSLFFSGLAISFLVLSVIVIIPAQQFDWRMVLSIVFLLLFILMIRFIVQPINRTKRVRALRNII